MKRYLWVPASIILIGGWISVLGSKSTGQRLESPVIVENVVGPKTQNNLKKLTFSYPKITAPVEIVSVHLYGQEIKSDEEFQAPDDWLRDLRFTLRNSSNKTIKSLIMTIETPPRTPQEGVALTELYLGKDYMGSATPNSNVEELSWKPGEAIEFHFNSGHPANYHNFLASWSRRNGSVAEITSARVYPASVIFEDINTGWHKGRYMERLPSGDSWKMINSRN